MRHGDLLGLATPPEPRYLLFFPGGFYASTKDVLAPLAAKADANRIRNCDFKTPLLHRRGPHRKAIRARCSVKRLVSPISGRVPTGVQFMGKVSRPTRNNLHQVHGAAEREGDLRGRDPGGNRTYRIRFPPSPCVAAHSPESICS